MNCFELHHGDCLEVLRTMPDNSVDSVVTDPPYGLSFMGKRWDYDVPSAEIWAECLRVLKPGGHLLAFAGTRTQHRMAVRIEDAGFEIRDMIAWVYGSGFPKSLDVSKAIDKAAGAERQVVGQGMSGTTAGMQLLGDSGIKGGAYDITAPATDAARQWSGWGTALKSALEPITVARKPLAGTVAANVLAHGTGALNIDGARITDGTETGGERPAYEPNGKNAVYGAGAGAGAWANTNGRWPANLIHDGSEPADMLGSAARFFYCAKASKRDRDEGLDAHQERTAPAADFRPNHAAGAAAGEDGNPYGRWQPRKNNHPTVKPTDLMAYLCRLVTPPGGTVLDPFMGSGSTGKACAREGFRFIGIERESEYLEIARARIEAANDNREAGAASA